MYYLKTKIHRLFNAKPDFVTCLFITHMSLSRPDNILVVSRVYINQYFILYKSI